MGLKDIKDFSAEEVGLWFTAQGLDPSTVVSEGVDGDLLLSLSSDDFKADLGLSSLQAKKVLKNIEFAKELNKKAVEGGVEDAENLKEEMEALSLGKTSLEEKVHELEAAMASKDDEISELKSEIEEMKVKNETKAAAPAPQPAPAPAPKAAPPPSHHRGPGVVGGAARGAAGGAVKGAIAGAILPGMDAGDGAAAGAAVGAASGGMRGLRGRRAARRMR